MENTKYFIAGALITAVWLMAVFNQFNHVNCEMLVYQDGRYSMSEKEIFARGLDSCANWKG